MKVSPLFRMILSFSNFRTRIFGPCKSARMPTVRPHALAAARTVSALFIWSWVDPCEKFMRPDQPRRVSFAPALFGCWKRVPALQLFSFYVACVVFFLLLILVIPVVVAGDSYCC